PRHTRKLQTGPQSLFGQHVAVTDATGADLDSHLPRPRIGNGTFDEFQWTTGGRNLNGTHGWHNRVPERGWLQISASISPRSVIIPSEKIPAAQSIIN